MKKNYAYVTFLTSESYYSGVILLKASLEKVNSKYPLYCAITEDISMQTQQNLSSQDINIIKVQKTETPEYLFDFNKQIDERMANTWKHCLTKFQAFKFTQFDKVILLDCDLMLLKNVDDCFEKPHMTASQDGEYFGLWQGWTHFNSGFIVIQPEENEYNALIDFANNIDVSNVTDAYGRHYVIAD